MSILCLIRCITKNYVDGANQKILADSTGHTHRFGNAQSFCRFMMMMLVD